MKLYLELSCIATIDIVARPAEVVRTGVAHFNICSLGNDSIILLNIL
jgi:hypothetical protein